MYLFPVPSSMQPGTKRQQIRQVWEWSGEPLPDATFELNEALDDGVGTPGAAFHAHKLKEFLFLIRVMEVWTRLSASRREAQLADPWAFAKWLGEQDETGTRQLRHILLYLFFPQPLRAHGHGLLQERHRTCLRKGTRGRPGGVRLQGPDRLDQQILVIREKLQEKGAAPDFEFFDEPFRTVWKPDSGGGSRRPSVSRRVRAMVSGEVRGSSRVGARAGRGRAVLGSVPRKGDHCDRDGMNSEICGTMGAGKAFTKESARAYGAANPTMDSLPAINSPTKCKPGTM